MSNDIVASAVTDSVSDIWNKTKIPTQCSYMKRFVAQKVKKLLDECKSLLKLPKERREQKVLEHNLNVLFDISSCKHGFEACDCPKDKKVPQIWKDFLSDQQSDRKIFLSDKVDEDSSAGEAKTKARRERSEERLNRQREDWNESKKLKVASSEDMNEMIGSDSENELDEDLNSDEDWVDLDDPPKKKQKRVPLSRFVREVDRFKVSYRAAAAIGNAFLKDHAIALKIEDVNEYLIDASKLQRERARVGKSAEAEKKQSQSSINALGFDGKKSKTLVKVTTEIKVTKRGRRGRGNCDTAEKTAVKTEVEDHYTIIEEPSGAYVTHVTPLDKPGTAIADEIVAVVRERGIQLEALAADGTAANTGERRGAIRLIEQDLDKALQHLQCLLHINELPLRAVFTSLDGPTTGPKSFEGPIGKEVVQVYSLIIQNIPCRLIFTFF